MPRAIKLSHSYQTPKAWDTAVRGWPGGDRDLAPPGWASVPDRARRELSREPLMPQCPYAVPGRTVRRRRRSRGPPGPPGRETVGK
eukprot:202026-Hanusia_phi.AAC.2